MRVSLVGSWEPVLGVSQFLREQVPAIAKRLPVEVISIKALVPRLLHPARMTRGERYFPPEDFRVRYPLSWYNPPGWVWEGAAAKGRVLHLHWWTWALGPMYLGLLAGGAPSGKKLVLEVHNPTSHEALGIEAPFLWPLVRAAGAIVVHTEASRRRALELGWPGEKLRVLPHGPLNFYKKMAKPLRIGLPEGPKVLFFGNTRPYKGLDILIGALAELPGVWLVVGGRKWKGWRTYLALAEKLGVKERVYITGFVPDDQVAPLFRACDLVVLPYKAFAGASGVAAIAWALGTPLVVSDVGSLPEHAHPEGVARPNPSDLSRAIARVLRDQDLREELAEFSATMAERNSWDRVAEGLVEIYETLKSHA